MTFSTLTLFMMLISLNTIMHNMLDTAHRSDHIHCRHFFFSKKPDVTSQKIKKQKTRQTHLIIHSLSFPDRPDSSEVLPPFRVI